MNKYFKLSSAEMFTKQSMKQNRSWFWAWFYPSMYIQIYPLPEEDKSGLPIFIFTIYSQFITFNIQFIVRDTLWSAIFTLYIWTDRPEQTV